MQIYFAPRPHGHGLTGEGEWERKRGGRERKRGGREKTGREREKEGRESENRQHPARIYDATTDASGEFRRLRDAPASRSIRFVSPNRKPCTAGRGKNVCEHDRMNR